jgi:hypothetical protein
MAANAQFQIVETQSSLFIIGIPCDRVMKLKTRSPWLPMADHFQNR